MTTQLIQLPLTLAKRSIVTRMTAKVGAAKATAGTTTAETCLM